MFSELPIAIFGLSLGMHLRSDADGAVKVMCHLVGHFLVPKSINSILRTIIALSSSNTE